MLYWVMQKFVFKSNTTSDSITKEDEGKITLGFRPKDWKSLKDLAKTQYL